MEDITTPLLTNIGGTNDWSPIYGRCPSCGFIVEDAFDYDSAGNEIFRCERPTCRLVFAQDSGGGYVVYVDGEPLA